MPRYISEYVSDGIYRQRVDKRPHPRWFQRLKAWVLGAPWRMCPICGKDFGWHEPSLALTYLRRACASCLDDPVVVPMSTKATWRSQVREEKARKKVEDEFVERGGNFTGLDVDAEFERRRTA